MKARPAPDQRVLFSPGLVAGNRFADLWAKKSTCQWRVDFRRVLIAGGIRLVCRPARSVVTIQIELCAWSVAPCRRIRS
eukprot:9463858-Pyramimonas_sp.AAC.1